MQSEERTITTQGEQQQCKAINNNARQGVYKNNTRQTTRTNNEQ